MGLPGLSFMRLTLLLAALSLALAPSAGRAEPDDAPIFTPEAVKAHVDFLADDLLEGRDAGTRGYDIAARYVATRFEALGLKPGGPGGSWYQQVPLSRYALDPAKPAMLAVGARRFANGGDVLIGATPRAGNATQHVSADAVFVGFGLADDYAGLDVRGRFAVVLLGIPRDLGGAAAEAAKVEDKARNASERGAIGVIYVSTPATGADMPWSTLAGYILEPQYRWLSPEGVPGGIDPRIQSGAYVRGKAAAALFEGTGITAEGLMASLASPGGRPKGFPLARKVTIARTSKVATTPSPNVIGILPGADPELAREYVVLSAHLDHEGVDPNLPGPDRIYNGAMDNAAGVATMLEAARAFAESGDRPKRSILFVALTAEEDGLLGSEYLARYPVTGSGKMIADVNLDMPMLLYDFKDVVAFGAEHSTMGPIVEAAAAKMGVTLSPDPMPEENLFVRSDHYSFVQRGVPSVFLVTGFANGGEKAFRDFLAHHYHKVSDQTDLPFDWAAGAKFARLNYLIAREIADGDEAPRWYAGNPYGDRFAPGQPRANRPEK
jgi:Zn-dependent M28 family amino/carboxypeptidase